MSILKNKKINIDRLLNFGKKPMATSEQTPENQYYSYNNKRDNIEPEPEKEKLEARAPEKSKFEARF